MIYWGFLPKACHCLKQAVRSIRRHVLAQSTDYEINATINCPGNLTSEMHIASPSDTASGSSLHYFAHIVKIKFVLIHVLTGVVQNHRPPTSYRPQTTDLPPPTTDQRNHRSEKPPTNGCEKNRPPTRTTTDHQPDYGG